MPTFSTYPKAYLEGGEWHLRLEVVNRDTQEITRLFYTCAAGEGMDVFGQYLLLKLCFDVITGEGATPQDVLDLIVTVDVKPGGGYETVFGNWIIIAEEILTALGPSCSVADFWASFGPEDQNAIRASMAEAVKKVKWSIPVGSIHQHNGDGTVTEL